MPEEASRWDIRGRRQDLDERHDQFRNAAELRADRGDGVRLANATLHDSAAKQVHLVDDILHFLDSEVAALGRFQVHQVSLEQEHRRTLHQLVGSLTRSGSAGQVIQQRHKHGHAEAVIADPLGWHERRVGNLGQRIATEQQQARMMHLLTIDPVRQRTPIGRRQRVIVERGLGNAGARDDVQELKATLAERRIIDRLCR
ncbi:hypothetical protein D3C80_1434140 [compost metagenome]